jgi:tetratricopeptide (TPR) repeat protein
MAITCSMLADTEISAEAKAIDCKRGVNAAMEALRIYDEKDHPLEHAETQILLWAAYSALAEVEEKQENCQKAIDASLIAVGILDKISPAEHADALKNLGYSFITLAENVDKAENCRKAIEAYEKALQYHTQERAPLEAAEILRDLAFAYFTLSEVEDKAECGKKALKAYKKAFKIYKGMAEELEEANDPAADETRDLAEKCHRSLESCKSILKAGRKSGTANPEIGRSER